MVYHKIRHLLLGILVAPNIKITHILLIDDILIFYNGLHRDILEIKEDLSPIEATTCMIINHLKSTLIPYELSEDELLYIQNIFLFELTTLDVGFTYIGFHIKLNSYKEAY